MSNFEISSNAFSVEEQHTGSSFGIYDFNKHTKPRTPYNETYLKDFIKYSPSSQTLEARNEDNLEDKFNEEIKEADELKLIPYGQTDGFIGFGGFSSRKLPEPGKQWSNSDGLETEERIYLELTYVNSSSAGDKANKKTVVWFNTSNNSAVDLIYGDTFENCFEIVEDDNGEQIIIIKSDFYNIFQEILPEALQKEDLEQISSQTDLEDLTKDGWWIQEEDRILCIRYYGIAYSINYLLDKSISYITFNSTNCTNITYLYDGYKDEILIRTTYSDNIYQTIVSGMDYLTHPNQLTFKKVDGSDPIVGTIQWGNGNKNFIPSMIINDNSCIRFELSNFNIDSKTDVLFDYYYSESFIFSVFKTLLYNNYNFIKTKNILTSYESDDFYLDIPNQIDENIVGGIDNTAAAVNQAIIPVNDFFLMGQKFLTDLQSGQSNKDFMLLRSYPTYKYIVNQSEGRREEQTALLNNILVLEKNSLKDTKITDIDKLLQGYSNIYYGIYGLGNSKITNFTIRDSDFYPYNDINFAIEDTPFLGSFIGTYDTNYTDVKGLLKYEDTTASPPIYQIHSISSNFLKPLLIFNEYGNYTLNISKLIEKIGSEQTIEDYAFASPEKLISKIVFDKTGNNQTITLNQKSFYTPSPFIKEIEITEDAVFPDPDFVFDSSNKLFFNFSPEGTKLSVKDMNFMNGNKFFDFLKYSFRTNQLFSEIYMENCWYHGNTGIPIYIDKLKKVELSGGSNYLTRLMVDFFAYNTKNIVFDLTLKNYVNPGVVTNSIPTFSTLNIAEAYVSSNYLEYFDRAKIKKIILDCSQLDSIKTALKETITMELFHRSDTAETFEPLSSFSDWVPRLETLKIKQNIKIDANCFEDLENLKNIYLPELMIKDITDNNLTYLGLEAFYGDTPKNIYIYINADSDYFKNKRSYTYQQWRAVREWPEQFESQKLFPYNSKIYLVIEGEENNYQYIGQYQPARIFSKSIFDLESFTYGEIEAQGDYVNNDNEGGNE